MHSDKCKKCWLYHEEWYICKWDWTTKNIWRCKCCKQEYDKSYLPEYDWECWMCNTKCDDKEAIEPKIKNQIWELQALIRMHKREKTKMNIELDTTIYQIEQQIDFLDNLLNND